MTPKQLALYTLFFFLGLSIGGKITNLAYKPLFVAQAIEIYQMEEDNRQIQERHGLLKVELEILRQDMNQFMDRPTLLKSLGIEVENKVDKEK